MQLRVTRPGFLEGIQKVKAAQGIANYDVNRDATRQEMRAYVCGQCHVEYYFKGPEKRLTYPWDKGLKADEILAYYEENGFQRLDARGNWRAHVEGAASGVRDVEPGHARPLGRRVRRLPHAVPARRRDEDQRSPRPQPAAEHQPRLPDVPPLAGRGAARARAHDPGPHVPGAQHRDGCAGRADCRHQGRGRRGATDAQLETARRHQRRAQFLLDFIEAENSMGFHAGQEAMRILALSLDETRRGQVSLSVKR